MVVFKALHEIVSACLSLSGFLVCVSFSSGPFVRLFAAGSGAIGFNRFLPDSAIPCLSTGSFFFFSCVRHRLAI